MIAIDTNVLIYACDLRVPRLQQRAFEIIANAKDGILLWQVACEFIAATRKLANQGFTEAHAWDRLKEYMDLFPLVLPTQDTLRRASHLHLVNKLAYWDAMIVAACLETGITRLYSQDIPGSSVAQIEIVNPFADITNP